MVLDQCQFGLRTVWVGHRRRVPSTLLRATYELLRGPIPDGHHLHHVCGLGACSNVDHLIPVTPDEHRRIHSRPFVATSPKV